MKWQTFLIACVSAGLVACASSPTPNPWADIDKPALTAERPLELPDLPEPVAVDLPEPVATNAGTVTYKRSDVLEFESYMKTAAATYDIAGLREWENYVGFAEANTIVADANADALVEQKRSVGHLVDAGHAQYQVAELRKEMLEDERRRRFWDSVTHWVIIVVLGVAAL